MVFHAISDGWHGFTNNWGYSERRAADLPQDNSYHEQKKTFSIAGYFFIPQFFPEPGHGVPNNTGYNRIRNAWQGTYIYAEKDTPSLAYRAALRIGAIFRGVLEMLPVIGLLNVVPDLVHWGATSLYDAATKGPVDHHVRRRQ